MSKRKPAKSAAWYRAALLGVEDSQGELSPGLRGVARGFKASEGFNLRDLREGRWTAAQKRKVTMYFHELQQLTAQEKVTVKTRSPKRLAQAQAIGGHDPKYKFKVAFVPGSKNAKVEWTDEGLVIRERGYSKIEAAFNPEALAADAQAEVERVLSQKRMKRAQRFRIKAGANLIGTLYDAGNVGDAVRKLMAKYDGVKALPRSSGNVGDNPAAHDARKWLNGVTGYVFPFNADKRRPDAANRELDRNRELQRRRANKRKAGKRK